MRSPMGEIRLLFEGASLCDEVASSLEDATPDAFYYAHLPQMKEAAQDASSGAPRVARRVGRFAASDHRRRGKLCTFSNPPAVHS
jgi:hypothetical protein